MKHWKTHKPQCLERQEHHRDVAENDALNKEKHKAFGLPSSKIRQQILEDFNELHRHSLEQAFTCALRAGRLNPYTQHVKLLCSYRPENHMNPSNAFRLDHMLIVNDPPLGSPISRSFVAFRATMKEADAEMHRDDAGYLGAVVTSCKCNFSNTITLFD